MKILFAQTYYLPYVSGLTIYAQRIASGLVNSGHQVEIVVSQHDKSLKRNEVVDRIKITRVPYSFKLSKGFFSLLWPLVSFEKVIANDVVVCNLPQVEAFWLFIFAKMLGKRSVAIYTCEVKLSGGLINLLVGKALYIFNWLACLLADKILCYTKDYAENTKLLKNFKHKQTFILPPVLISEEDKKITQEIAKRINRRPDEKVLGFAARISAEKGLEYLLDAIPLIEKQGLKVKVVCAGPRKEVVGEEEYYEKIMKLANKLNDKVVFLGTLNFQEMRSFYENIDVLVLPSLNSTEAFGIVQGEAMLCGKPVIASDLPGVRVPVKLTQMGKAVPVGNVLKLAEAIAQTLKQRKAYPKHKARAQDVFDPNVAIQAFEDTLTRTSLQ